MRWRFGVIEEEILFPSGLAELMVRIPNFPVILFSLRHSDAFSTLCVVQADLSLLSGSAEPKSGRNGKKYWTIVFSVEIHFGLTEFKARIKWMDNVGFASLLCVWGIDSLFPLGASQIVSLPSSLFSPF